MNNQQQYPDTVEEHAVAKKQFQKARNKIEMQKTKLYLCYKKKEKQKMQFQKAIKNLENTIGKEIGYYFKESDKAKFKHPGAEQQVAWIEKKCCTKCKKEKPLMVFRKNNTGSGNIIRADRRRNRRPDCNACYSKMIQSKNIAKAYAKKSGIPYKAPEGTVCGICEELGTKDNPLVFDHDHKRNVFRGYCHNRCNIGLGIIGDDTFSVIRVLRYIIKRDGQTKEQVIHMIFSEDK